MLQDDKACRRGSGNVTLISGVIQRRKAHPGPWGVSEGRFLPRNCKECLRYQLQGLGLGAGCGGGEAGVKLRNKAEGGMRTSSRADPRLASLHNPLGDPKDVFPG